MRTDEQWRLPGIVGALPDAENIADPVDGDFQPGLPEPADKEVTALFVCVGGGEPDQPLLTVAADGAEFPDAAKQTLCIDPDHGYASAFSLPASTSAGLCPTSSV